MRVHRQRLPDGGHDRIGDGLHALDVQVAIERHICHHNDLARPGDDRFEVDDLVDARGGLDSLDERPVMSSRPRANTAAATTMRRTPMPALARASKTGAPVAWCRARPSSASTVPATEVALSSTP